jgi:hypothetical protein
MIKKVVVVIILMLIGMSTYVFADGVEFVTGEIIDQTETVLIVKDNFGTYFKATFPKMLEGEFSNLNNSHPVKISFIVADVYDGMVVVEGLSLNQTIVEEGDFFSGFLVGVLFALALVMVAVGLSAMG